MHNTAVSSGYTRDDLCGETGSGIAEGARTDRWGCERTLTADQITAARICIPDGKRRVTALRVKGVTGDRQSGYWAKFQGMRSSTCDMGCMSTIRRSVTVRYVCGLTPLSFRFRAARRIAPRSWRRRHCRRTARFFVSMESGRSRSRPGWCPSRRARHRGSGSDHSNA